jgi:hypothetical protein
LPLARIGMEFGLLGAYRKLKKALNFMKPDEQKEILEIWQVLGLSLMYITGDKEEFFKTVKEELGYQWDGEGWRKVMQLH